MAYLDDQLTDEERRQAEAAGGSAPAGGGAASPAAAAPRAPSSGFSNLSNYFAANKDAATEQGGALAAGLEADANSALRSDSPGTAMETLGRVNAAATPGGLATDLDAAKKDDQRYTAGMAGLDAYLGTRGAAPGAFEGLRAHFGERLGKVELPASDPGPYMGGNSGDITDTQARQDYANRLNEYEAWRKRRAANIGEPYMVDPEHGDPDLNREAEERARNGEILWPVGMG